MSSNTLEYRLELMARDSTLEPSLITYFGSWVRRAADEELYRIPVLRWAETHHVTEDEAIDLFLYAARAGIVDLQWGVLCPACGVSIRTPGGLKALGPNPHCQLCRLDFPAAMDDQVEVTFSVEPAIRNLRFYDPERVDPRRDTLQMYFSPSIEVDAFREHLVQSVLAARRIEPGARGTLALEAQPDHLYAVMVANIHAVGFVSCDPDGPSSVELECQDGGMIPPRAGVGPGPVRIDLLNRAEWTVDVTVFDMGEHYEGEAENELPPEPTYRLRPFLNGKRVLTSQTFRDLFRGEVIGEQGLRIRNLAVVFSDLEASTALYERVGDLRALELVREHFDRMSEVVARHRGALVKTIGDAVMAAFGDTDRAVAAAAGMVRAARRIDADGMPLQAKVGIHSGSCIAIQTNHQIDYFGSAVNVAARVQGTARGGEIVVTDRVWMTPGVQGMVADFGLDETPDQVDLRGIASGVAVHRLR